MLERQDIDALLIGSLYGELSSADEARLTAHLESHPADRTALADLSHARTIVRESRILQVEFDPPQSISALLLQEAVRRAPKAADAPSWFQRFVKSFMLHPAMAAAAMLVLIIGVASTMYSRKGDQYTAPTKDNSTAPASFDFESSRSGAPTKASELSANEQQVDDLKQELQTTVPSGTTVTGGDNFTVSLDDNAAGEDVGGRGQDQPSVRDGESPQRERAGFKGNAGSTVAPAPPPPKVVAKTPSRILEVTTEDKAPKDLASPDSPVLADPSSNIGGASRTAGKLRKPAAVEKPAEPPGTAQSPATDRRVAPTTLTAQVAHEERLKADTELAWAKDQHSRAIAQVKAGNCTNAASIAVAISNRAPGYYAQNVELDRTIKPCITYINAQREKAAERAQRQKASRRTVDEPAKAAPTTTTK